MKIQLMRMREGWQGAALAVTAAISLASGAALAEDPMPSEMMPKAPESLLLDIDKAGGNFVTVGERGHVLVSSDAETFVQKQTPVRATLTAVDFVDAKNGWAVGHDAVIIATSDGGETWSLQNWDPELEKPFLDVMFLDAQRGMAVGAYGLYLQTNNGGKTWSVVENDVTMEEWHLTSIIKLNDGALLIAGEAGGLALSRDEGETWVKMESPYEGSFFGALPWGEAGAMVFGLRGNVFVTDALPALDSVEEVGSDGEEMDPPSAEWTHLKTNTVQSFMGGSLLPDGGAVLVGVNGVVSTIEPNGTATLIKNPVTLGYSAVMPLKGRDILVVGEGGTYPYTY